MFFLLSLHDVAGEGFNYLLKEELKKKNKRRKKKPATQRPSLREKDGDAKAPFRADRRPSAFPGHREFGAALVWMRNRDPARPESYAGGPGIVEGGGTSRNGPAGRR